MKVMPALPVLPAVLALMTYSQPPNVSPAIATVSACNVVTASEILSFTGRPMTRTFDRRAGLESTCDYASGEAVVTIVLRRSPRILDLPAEVGNLRSSFPEASLRNVEGLGGAAILVELGEPGVLLNVFRDEHHYLLVSILGFGEDFPASRVVEKIARRALDRL